MVAHSGTVTCMCTHQKGKLKKVRLQYRNSNFTDPVIKSHKNHHEPGVEGTEECSVGCNLNFLGCLQFLRVKSPNEHTYLNLNWVLRDNSLRSVSTSSPF